MSSTGFRGGDLSLYFPAARSPSVIGHTYLLSVSTGFLPAIDAFFFSLLASIHIQKHVFHGMVSMGAAAIDIFVGCTGVLQGYLHIRVDSHGFLSPDVILCG